VSGRRFGSSGRCVYYIVFRVAERWLGSADKAERKVVRKCGPVCVLHRLEGGGEVVGQCGCDGQGRGLPDREVVAKFAQVVLHGLVVRT
jgi:hypothetical protein